MKTAAAVSADAAGRTAPTYVREHRYAIATVAILAAMLLVVGVLTLQNVAHRAHA